MLTRPVARVCSVLFLWGVVVCVAITTCAQSPSSIPSSTSETHAPPVLVSGTSPPIDPATSAALDSLASRVVRDLPKHAKNILVLDFAAITGVHTPLGEWLGDQFSLALAREGPKLQFVNRAEVPSDVRAKSFSFYAVKDVPSQQAEAEALCKQTGAKILISGTYGPAENGVGLSVRLDCVSSKVSLKLALDSPQIRLALTPDVSDRLGISPSALRPPDGVYLEGEGGVSYPKCLRCPPPQFTKEAIDKLEGGVVYLSIVVTTNGRADQIEVIQGLPAGLTDAAVDAVRSWIFDPARDLDNHPVAVRTAVEVQFRFYH